MAQSFQYSVTRKIVNRILISMLRRNISPRNYFLLTVPGRITGKPHSVPVALVSTGMKRWLVAPYGNVDWVKNARAAGELTLSKGTSREIMEIRELPLSEAAPVLKSYLETYPITKSYFNATTHAPDHDFVEDAKYRPVFELIPSSGKDDA